MSHPKLAVLPDLIFLDILIQERWMSEEEPLLIAYCLTFIGSQVDPPFRNTFGLSMSFNADPEFQP